MKEFVTAVEQVTYDDEREAKIAALIEQGKTRDEAIAETEPYIPFKLDGREMRAFYPHDGQLAFMLASMGRGQAQTDRFASIINVMLASLRDDDKDYLEGRLLEKDPKKRIGVKQVEGIFEFLVEQWFENPTQESSTSASPPPTTGSLSTPTTTPSAIPSSGSPYPGS